MRSIGSFEGWLLWLRCCSIGAFSKMIVNKTNVSYNKLNKRAEKLSEGQPPADGIIKSDALSYQDKGVTFCVYRW